MKSKKMFSVILSISLSFSSMSFCFSQENKRVFDEKAFNDIKNWAENYNKNCTLPDNNDYTKCTFNDGKIELIKFKNEDFKISNSTDVFANYNGDDIWLYKGKPKFYKIKNGLVAYEDLIDLLSRWGGLPKELEKLNVEDEEEIMQSHIVEKVSSLWSWWYLPAAGVMWLVDLFYKNYKLTHKNNLNNPHGQTTYYQFNDNNAKSEAVYQENQSEVTKTTVPPLSEYVPQEKTESIKEKQSLEPESSSNEKKEEFSNFEEKSSRAEDFSSNDK